MPDPRQYQFNFPDTSRPGPITLVQKIYPGVEDTWSHCTSVRDVDPLTGINTIVIHATADSKCSSAITRMTNGEASFHWLIPAEKEPAHGHHVWSCVPEERAAWLVKTTVIILTLIMTGAESITGL